MHAGIYPEEAKFETRLLAESSQNMGVQHLWNILEQSKRVESVEKLRDKTLCIDLSIWICEAQGTKGLKDQLKPYLRNVFFRTMYLVSIGVRPVFVIDGIPPELKRETILKRLDTRCEQSGKRKNVSDKQRKLKRSKFNIWCNECCEMLRLLGIPFVKSEGEAEAMCALLNINQYADGVLTDDGDVFLYGAQVVYKDFNISSSKLLTDCLQVYRMKDIKSQLGLNRRNMIALALLLGCDYVPSGVPGIGKETAVRLLNSLSGVDLLDRFREWKASPDVHPEHYTSLEVTVKRKAVKVPDFPNKEVMKEFLSPNVGKRNFSIKWTCPDLEGIKEFFFRKLEWPKDYTEEKMLNLATDWQLAYSSPSLKPLFVPVRIVKPRIKQKIHHYEVEWKTQDSSSKWPITFVSIKPKDVMLEKHSMIVESFESELITKKSKSKTKKKDLKSKAGDELIESLAAKVDNMSLKEIPTFPSEDDKENEVTTQAGESAINTKTGKELPGYSLIDNMAINSNALDEFPERGARLKLKSFPLLSLDNNLDFSSQHPGLLDTHQPITCDLKEDTTMVDLKHSLKPLHTLGVVSRRTKNATCVDNKTVFVDLSCSEQSLKLTNLKCAGSSKISPVAFSGDPHLVEHGQGKILNCLESPAANEKTAFNLVDITIDSSFGSDLGTMEDLLASSFVAQLKDMSDGDQPGVCDYHERFRSPRPKVNDYVIPRCSENLSQRLTNEIHPDQDNDSYLDSFERLDLPNLNEFTSSKNELQSYKGRGNDDIDCNGSNNTRQAAENGSCVFTSSTPQLVEESSLTSRLLKRFRSKDGCIENTLRLISSDGDVKKHESCAGKEESTKPVKPVKTYSRPRVASEDSRPLNNITNQIKKTDIAFVVLD